MDGRDNRGATRAARCFSFEFCARIKGLIDWVTFKLYCKLEGLAKIQRFLTFLGELLRERCVLAHTEKHICGKVIVCLRGMHISKLFSALIILNEE